MSFEQQVRNIEADLVEKVKGLLSPTKKNIVFFLPIGNYYKQLGTLAKKLAEKHHVILAKCSPMPADFETQFASTVSVAWLVNTPEGNMPIQIDLKEIDLMIEMDSRHLIGVPDDFLSKTATRILMPHSMLQAPKVAPHDYVIAPSKIFVECYGRLHPNFTNQLIYGGYPKFDSSLAQTPTQEPDRITYAPTLRVVDSLFASSICAGYDANLLEWLLENTDQKIAYRPHPIAYWKKVSESYGMLKHRFANESRLIFDETPGSGFYAQTQKLITDFSTTAYTFSFSTLRPSIFFAPLESNDIEMVKHIHRIGYAARNFRELKQILDKNEDKSQEIAAFRDECVFNVGRSEEAICEAIDSILCS
ncbi:MAG: hypothetical protein HDT12_03450 [Helicobacter sp.]|nr:hypothetical protein [Helicobacter sp.]